METNKHELHCTPKSGRWEEEAPRKEKEEKEVGGTMRQRDHKSERLRVTGLNGADKDGALATGRPYQPNGVIPPRGRSLLDGVTNESALSRVQAGLSANVPSSCRGSAMGTLLLT